MSAPPELPDIVRRAFDVSRRSGYVSFCRNETGRLLAALAATRTGTLAEFGTGTGVGTAWLRSGIRDGSRASLTAELDPTLAERRRDDLRRRRPGRGARRRLVDAARQGPVLAAVPRRPRAQGRRRRTPIVDLVEPGGVVVLDDFTPCSSWPPVYEGRVDVLREQWLTDERFTTVEVMVAPDASVLIATER